MIHLTSMIVGFGMIREVSSGDDYNVVILSMEGIEYDSWKVVQVSVTIPVSRIDLFVGGISGAVADFIAGNN